MGWQAAMRPGEGRKLEPGSEEAQAEGFKAPVRGRMEHLLLRVKRWVGAAFTEAG